MQILINIEVLMRQGRIPPWEGFLLLRGLPLLTSFFPSLELCS